MIWHDAKKHKPQGFGQYLVADNTTEEGVMWVADWDWVIYPDAKHGFWDCSPIFDEYKITHWAEIEPPYINKQTQWTNIQDPMYLKAPSPSKSSSHKQSLNTSTP